MQLGHRLGREARERDLSPAIDAVAAERAFLQTLKQRVEWQALAAAQVRRGAPLAAPEPPPVPAPPVVPVSTPVEPAPPAPAVVESSSETGGAWTIEQLERLVADREATDPERAREWSYYVLYLREYADDRGWLPARFDALVDATFADR